MNFGVDYASNILGIFTNAVGNGSVNFGWIPGDTGGGWVGQVRRLAGFSVFTNNRLYLSQLSTSGETLIDMDDGNLYVGATEDLTIECDAFIPKTGVTTIDIGKTGNQFRNLYLSGDISYRRYFL